MSRNKFGLLVLPLLLAGGAATAAEIANNEHPFLAATAAAMDRMMAAMTIKPSGDVDRDFEAMMTPHHQGAIDMAVAELKYGRNDQLKRIAQEIIVDQQQEIAAMQLALGKPLPPSMPAPTQGAMSPMRMEH
ncbi:DUF305 domain-containing protein [Sphingomonas populi]|uniref:DUF305 domain-containing protein n=1 Tax=Sphingomonas populi TaxID=2484750 RepID=A0A4Q6XSV2_9SPHN|nr:DUF305 domain-containing protein [Sphingomonas populi]RZF60554.1 DUF305 domain-containing protein [Sphingomonas populi]